MSICLIFKVQFVRKLIFESDSQLVKSWQFGMAANLTYDPKTPVYDELEMRLINHVSYKVDL